MGQALLCARGGVTATGNEINLFGHNTTASAEGPTQVSCTEGATFSNLGFRVYSGGSGTNTIVFRDAGANGNQTVSFAGASAGEDTINSDVLSAGDLFNIAYTDTGSNSTIAWVKANIQFASGHGNFHGIASYGGVVHDAASETRFIALVGAHTGDGVTTEDNAEWKVRGYDSFEALQVRVTANARLNTSTFRNRINGADGTALVEFATLVTGLVSDTAVGDAITDGQTVNASITLDTGVEDLTVVFVTGSFKSSSNKSETWCGLQSGRQRTASSTANYFPIGGFLDSLTATNESQSRVKVGFAAVVSNLRCYLSANTYTGNGTLKLYQNGSAVLTTTITASGGAAWYENTSDTITIDADDELSFEFDEGTSGSITIHSAGITFAPVAAPSAEGVLYGPRNYTDGLTSFWSR